MAIATIAALLVGPVLAVLVTRYIDDSRLKYSRRMDVFRTLMRTRRTRLNPEHVEALNLVEIEFHGEDAVLSAWRSYWNHLQEQTPQDPNLQEKFYINRDGLLTKLLHAMARSLKFDIEQLDIFEGGYVPQGWFDDEQSGRELRALALEILNGRRGIPVVPLAIPMTSSPYPPPPEVRASPSTTRGDRESS